MYTVNSKVFILFSQAVEYANRGSFDIFLTENIERGPVWTKSENVCSKKNCRYLDQKAAYEAQAKLKKID